MTERRPHWDDDLIDAVFKALSYTYLAQGWAGGIAIDLDESVYPLIAAVEDWQDARGDAIDGRSLTEAIFAVQRVRALPARQIVGSDGHVRDMLLRADVLRALGQ